MATVSDTPRRKVLDEANELIHSARNVSYGPPMRNFQRIADLWNVILGEQLSEPITSWQVADMSIAIKLARNIEQPKRDSYVDMAGYAACGWECADGDGRLRESIERLECHCWDAKLTHCPMHDDAETGIRWVGGP